MATQTQVRKENGKRLTASPSPKRQASGAAKERILVEFPTGLLMRADAAAREMEKNRSELIRTAVEQFLDHLESAEFTRELGEAYTANSAMNLSLVDEFAAVDREGL